MRLLLLSSFFPPVIGGTENYTYSVARGLRGLGHDVRVLCAGDWDQGDAYFNGYTDESYTDIPVRRLHLNWTKAPDPNRGLYDNPLVAEQVTAYLRSFQPDLVHTTSCYTLSASVIGAVRRHRIPQALTLTDYWFACPRITLLRSDGAVCNGVTTADDCTRCLMGQSRLYQRLSAFVPEGALVGAVGAAARIPTLSAQRGLRGLALDVADRKQVVSEALRQVDDVISPSTFLADKFRELGLSSDVHVVPHGHDLSWLAQYRGKRPSSQMRFGFLGQIARIKGVDVLVQAFQRARLGGQATLHIWGDLAKDPAYAAELQALVGDNPAIRLMGRYQHAQLADILADMDVLVVPSLWYENAPLVIQEAFAAETPVIASGRGGMAEAVTDGVNGLHFAPGNVDDLAATLRAVVERPEVVEAWQRGIPPVRTFEDELSELLGVYARLLDEQSATVDARERGIEEAVLG